jgi:hypothetical protein
MNKYRILAFSALLSLLGSQAWAQTNTMSSASIGTAVTGGGTATGVAVVTPLIGTAGNQPGSVQNNLAGLQYVAGQIPLDGAPASVAFFALSGAPIANVRGPAEDFTSYGTLVSPTRVNTYGDPASKLTPSSYSALTFAPESISVKRKGLSAGTRAANAAKLDSDRISPGPHRIPVSPHSTFQKNLYIRALPNMPQAVLGG